MDDFANPGLIILSLVVYLVVKLCIFFSAKIFLDLVDKHDPIDNVAYWLMLFCITVYV